MIVIVWFVPVITFSYTDDLLTRIDAFIKDNKDYTDRSDFINKAINKYFDLHQGNIFIRFYQYAGVQFMFFIIMITLSWILQNIYVYFLTALIGVLFVGSCMGFIYRYSGVRWLK